MKELCAPDIRLERQISIRAYAAAVQSNACAALIQYNVSEREDRQYADCSC